LSPTKSPNYDSVNASLLSQLDRATRELEVTQYRVQLIRDDLGLESSIRFGSGLRKVSLSLEAELQAMEEQLEKIVPEMIYDVSNGSGMSSLYSLTYNNNNNNN